MIKAIKVDLVIILMSMVSIPLTSCLKQENIADPDVRELFIWDNKTMEQTQENGINVSPYLLKELTWEMGSKKPEPINFFDPSAVGTVEGLSEREIEEFSLLTPITNEMLYTKGKYIVKLQCNGFTIEGHLAVVDTTPPVIEVPKRMEYEINDTILYKKDVIVSDNSNEIPGLMVDSSEVKPNMAGTYTVYYSAVDSAGNKAEATAEIIIKQGHKAAEEEVNSLADNLLAEILTDDMTQLEQLKAIFDWCYSNIRYTSDADKSGILQGAYDGIYYRAGDCYTFYASAAYMMNRCEIENLAVSRRGDTATHYWSLVKTDEGWYHFDCSPHKGGYKCFMQTDEQVREYARKNEGEEGYFDFDEENVPERATKIICNNTYSK